MLTFSAKDFLLNTPWANPAPWLVLVRLDHGGIPVFVTNIIWRLLLLAIPSELHTIGEVPVLCTRCSSENTRTYTTEMAIHFPGLSGINIPHVFAFPEILVCMDCGTTEFTMPAVKLQELNTRTPAEERRPNSTVESLSGIRNAAFS